MSTYSGILWPGTGGGGGGSTSFLGLTDTPSSYTGQAGKVTAVNSGASALEFIDVITVNLTSPQDGDILEYDSGAGEWVNVPNAGGGGVDADATFTASRTWNLAGYNLTIDSIDQFYVNSGDVINLEASDGVTEKTKLLVSPSAVSIQWSNNADTELNKVEVQIGGILLSIPGGSQFLLEKDEDNFFTLTGSNTLSVRSDENFSTSVNQDSERFSITSVNDAETVENVFVWNQTGGIFNLSSGTYIIINSLEEYADNAAAITASLPDGALYRTGDNVKIVHQD